MEPNCFLVICSDPDEIPAQRRGIPSWPPIDVDPLNPTGVEKRFPAPDSPPSNAEFSRLP